MIQLSESNIDWHQVKTLLRAALKTDWRGSNSPMNANRAKASSFPPMLGLMFFNTFIGLGLAGFSFIIKNPFMASFLVLTFMAVFVSLTILLEFSNLILSPEEHRIISPLPVGSKTFFITKLLHLLLYVNILPLPIYIPSAVSVSFAAHNPLIFLSFSFASMLAATTIGMLFVVIYTMLLKIVNQETMQRVAAYAQFALTTAVYFFYIAVFRFIGKEGLITFRDFDSNWIYLAPPAWFAAIAKLPAGNIKAFDLYAFLAGITTLAIFFFAGLSKLSLEYSKNISTTVAHEDKKYTPKKRGFISRLICAVSSHEDRAVWPLIRKQFKYDNRFKMSILSIFPLTIFYVYMDFSNGKTMLDPFITTIGNHSGPPNFMIYFAVSLFPFMVITNTAFSESFQSAWVFFTSPADRTRIVLSSSRFALYFFCLPFCIFLFFLFNHFFNNILHAFLHFIFLFALLMILIKIMVLAYPRIPFSQTYKKGTNSMNFFIMFLLMLLVNIPLTIISMLGYGGYIGYCILLGIVLCINMLFHAIIKKNIPGRIEKLQL